MAETVNPNNVRGYTSQELMARAVGLLDSPAQSVVARAQVWATLGVAQAQREANDLAGSAGSSTPGPPVVAP